jgi:O-acetyl-ADP-ribose deacetylase (regulator of RNase III)
MRVTIVQGDLLDQDVDVVVNAWNRNLIPWWLLWPHGVSAAIKRRAGTGPFRELGRRLLPLGGARLTSAGRLPFKGIIHVAGINLCWLASEPSVRDSVRNAMALAHQHGFQSVALPLIGAGAGGMSQERVEAIMVDEFSKWEFPIEARIVEYRPKSGPE